MRFRIVHISDLHFHDRNYNYSLVDYSDDALHLWKKGHNQRKVDNLAQWLYRNQDGYDLILITGDLSHTGDEGDLKLAYSFINSSEVSRSRPWKNTNGHSTISNIKKEKILLPGNHDRFERDKNRIPGNDQFSKIFSKFWSPNSRLRDNGIFPLNNSDEKIAIVSIDFSLEEKTDASKSLKEKFLIPFNYSFWGQGKVSDDILLELEVVTKKIRDNHPKIPIIWATHFPFKSKRSLRLVNKNLLIQCAEHCQVELILSGHTHKHEDDTSHPNLRNITAGSATSNCAINDKPENSFEILDLEVMNNQIKKIDITSIRWNDKNLFTPRYI
jgi:DNA repair exonuclease SbcCD nuclease subunit